MTAGPGKRRRGRAVDRAAASGKVIGCVSGGEASAPGRRANGEPGMIDENSDCYQRGKNSRDLNGSPYLFNVFEDQPRPRRPAGRIKPLME
ncbi:hypothetical protein EVAR_52916_1 [Eumeta japonica]|uniref:Uncharacterized protein n=1 Tax=Eumeta variegata TaxID=151549 RepID=A0A4C1Y5K5_EUMVA|nr:hypothetical protein EVAR_52916_1 [Eumeta japonica]